MLTIIFWVLIGFVLYAYAGYFVLLVLLSSIAQLLRDLEFLFGRRDRRPSPSAELPSVSLLVAAYNEEKVIAERVRNALASDYPSNKLEIVIASDGSSDQTAAIVREFEDQGVKLFDYKERAGKVSVLNKSIPQCSGEIVVLSDANTVYKPDAIRNLVRHFEDDSLGVSVGEMRLGSPDADYAAEQRYWQFELMLKFMENRLGVVVGGNGGIYAIRKKLFEPVPSYTITDDFVIPMKICAKNVQMVYEPEALAFEETARDIAAEATRRTRIAAGNFQSIWTNRALLNPLRGWIAFCFWSHKVARWLVPFELLGIFVVNAAMSLEPGLYRWLFAGQVTFYAMAGIGHVVRRPRALRRVFGLPHYFTVMNLSLLRGFIRCVFGRQATAWKRTER